MEESTESINKIIDEKKNESESQKVEHLDSKKVEKMVMEKV